MGFGRRQQLPLPRGRSVHAHIICTGDSRPPFYSTRTANQLFCIAPFPVQLTRALLADIASFTGGEAVFMACTSAHSEHDLQANTTPDLETPEYTILYKAAQYEVRSYRPYLISETSQPPGAGPASGSGFPELAGYLFGGNEASESMAMTTPVFTKPATATGDPESAKMQFVMEKKFSADSVPAPKAGSDIVTRTEDGGVKAVATFAGFPLDFEV